MTDAHVERETLIIDVNIPAHDARVTTALFRRTRQELIETVHGRCWICGATEAESGHPLEAHHYPIERSLAELVEWDLFIAQAMHGDYGPGPQSFDWTHFNPEQWETFVDDMMHNGKLLCKSHHIGKDEGIHTLPHPIWIAQRFAKDGYSFNSVEVIHHEQGTDAADEGTAIAAA